MFTEGVTILAGIIIDKAIYSCIRSITCVSKTASLLMMLIFFSFDAVLVDIGIVRDDLNVDT